MDKEKYILLGQCKQRAIFSLSPFQWHQQARHSMDKETIKEINGLSCRRPVWSSGSVIVMPISDCDARLNDFNVMFSHRAVRLSACDVILIIMVSGLMLLMSCLVTVLLGEVSVIPGLVIVVSGLAIYNVIFSGCDVRFYESDVRFSNCDAMLCDVMWCGHLPHSPTSHPHPRILTTNENCSFLSFFSNKERGS